MKLNRVVYRFWHTRSARGCVGYIGKDSYYPLRANLVKRSKDKACKMLYRALGKHPLKFWRVDVLASGFRKDETLNRAEIFYIKKFDSKNKGYNCTDGGEGLRGWVPSKAWRIERSRLLTGRKLSPEHIAKVVKSLIGRKHSIKTKAKISDAHIGMKVSVKTRKKLSKINMGLWVGKKNGFYGKKHSLESLTRMSRASKGRKLSFEHKEKISEALTGRKVSKETRKKISESQKGKKILVETRLKISKANTNPSLETREKLSRAARGRRHTPEAKERMRKAAQDWWDKQKAEQAKLNGREEGTNAG